jgi:hypothetical protein
MGDVLPDVRPKPAKPSQSDLWQAEYRRQLGKATEVQKERDIAEAKTDAPRIDALGEKMASGVAAYNELMIYFTGIQATRDNPNAKNKCTPDQKIKLSDGRTVTVAERCRELQDIIKRDLPKALEMADQILIDPKQRKLGDVRTTAKEDLAEYTKGGASSKDETRKALCKKLGLDPEFKKLDVQDIQVKLAQLKADKADQKDIDDCNKLLGLHQELERINLKMRAPAIVRLLWADFMSQGLLEGDPLAKLETLPGRNDVILIPENTAKIAHRLVREAGNLAGDVDLSSQIRSIGDPIQDQYLHYQIVHCRTVLDLKNKAAAEDDKSRKEELLKEALKESKAVNMPFLVAQQERVAQQIGALEKAGKRDGEEYKNLCKTFVALQTSADCVQIARYEYAKFLVSENRNNEAYPLLVRIETETPRLVQKVTTEDGKPYTAADKEKGKKALVEFDKEFVELKKKAMLGEGAKGKTAETALQEFGDAIDTDKDMKKALKCIQEARAAIDKCSTQLRKDEENIKAEKKQLERQLAELDLRTDMDQREKEIERKALTDNIKAMAAITKSVDDMIKLTARIDQAEGACQIALGNIDEARTLIRRAALDKDIAADPKFQELLELVKDKNWFEENWESIKKGLLITAAVVAGAAAAALTIWSGPGAALVGTGVAAAIITGGTALIAGTAAGAIVYTGGKWAVGDKVDWRTLVEGGGYGLTGATMVVTAGWGSAIAPEATTASVWTISGASNLALRVGATRLIPAISTSLVSNATEKGTAAYFDGLDKEKFQKELAALEAKGDLNDDDKKEVARLRSKIAACKEWDTSKFLWDSGRDALIYSLFKPIPSGAVAPEVAAKEGFHAAFRRAALAQGIKTPAIRVLTMKLIEPTVLPIAMNSGQRLYDAVTLPLDPKDPKNRNRIFERMPGSIRVRELLKDQ